MNKMKRRVMQTNFGRTIKRFLILAVCAVVLSGGISAFLLRTQIGEIASYAWQEEVRDEWQEGTLESDGLHGEDFWREEERTDLAKVITRPSAAAIAAACVTGVILLLAGAVYWLLVAAWLYQAAVLAKMHGMVWFLLGLCGNLAAVAVFLLLRSLIRKKCGECGSYQPVKAAYCAACGAGLTVKCPECGIVCEKDARYCRNCGKSLSEE